MSNGHSRIMFHESRAGAAAAIAALLMMEVMVTAFGSAFLIEAQDQAHLARAKIGLLLAAAMLLALVAMQGLYLIKMLFPSSLVLTDEGACNMGPFRSFSLLWQDYETAKVQMKFSRKGGRSCYIRLESKNGKDPVEIFRDGYTQPGDELFRCVKEAQSGRLIDPGHAPFPYGIVLGWIPLFLAASALLAWKFAPVLLLALSVITG